MQCIIDHWRPTLFLLLSLTAPVSAEPTGEVLILQNVMLPAGREDSEPKKVTLRIKDGSLDLVTEDSLEPDKETRVFDAKGGYVVGGLTLNQPATFLIINGDPTEHPYLLLDTRRYASFAASRGRVVRNHLSRQYGTEMAARRRAEQGWLSYTPPPVAMPGTGERSRWNQFDTRHVSGVLIGAMGMDRTNWLDQNDASRLQSDCLAQQQCEPWLLPVCSFFV